MRKGETTAGVCFLLAALIGYGILAFSIAKHFVEVITREMEMYFSTTFVV